MASFIGLTEDGHRSRTVLTFMVQSVSAKYHDVVKLITVDTLTADDLTSYVLDVMNQLDPFLHVIGLCADNHIVNR